MWKWNCCPLCDCETFAKVRCELFWIQLLSLGWALPCICFRDDFFSFIQGYCSCIDIMASGDMPVTMLSMGPCPPYPATVPRVTCHVSRVGACHLRAAACCPPCRASAAWTPAARARSWWSPSPGPSPHLHTTNYHYINPLSTPCPLHSPIRNNV